MVSVPAGLRRMVRKDVDRQFHIRELAGGGPRQWWREGVHQLYGDLWLLRCLGIPRVRESNAKWSKAMLLVLSIALASGCSSVEGTSPSTASASGTLGRLQQQAKSASLAQAECLKAAGWAITIGDDGGFGSSINRDQEKAFAADELRCRQEAAAEFPAPTVSEDEYHRLYAHQLKMVKCLEDAGYPPVGSIPSEQQYVDQAVREGGARWSAWEAVTGPPPSGLEQQCPQLPPNW